MTNMRSMVAQTSDGAGLCLTLLPCFPLEADVTANESRNCCNDGNRFCECLHKRDLFCKGEEQCKQKSADDALDQRSPPYTHFSVYNNTKIVLDDSRLYCI